MRASVVVNCQLTCRWSVLVVCCQAASSVLRVNRPGIARGSGSGHLAPLGDGVSIHDFTFNGSQVVD
jgi:hypothetical protein